MDSNASGIVKQAANTMDYASRHKGPTSPASPTPSDASHFSVVSVVSQDSGTTTVSPHAVSAYERTSYYNGVTEGGEHPDLLYRTGSVKYPWIQPTGRHATQPTKSLRGVHGTPLNGVWSTVGPQVCALVKSRVKAGFSIDTARFVTHGEDDEDILGPVVIWVAVSPDSTSADTAHEVSQDILELLKENGVDGVEVEWNEAVVWKAAGPRLLPVVGSNDPTVHVRRPFTAALGMPIATAEREEEDAQGTVGFFFYENCDKNGKPSKRVLGVSNRHVLRKKIEGTYEFKGKGAPRQQVRVCGLRRFQRALDDIKVAVSDCGIMADLHAREIIALEARGASDDPDEAKRDARELCILRRKLEEGKEVIEELEQFYEVVKAQWGDIELRNIGHVHYSPPLSVDVEGERYTEDWATFELDEAKFQPHFKGNVVDLGTAIPPEKLTTMMYPRNDSNTTFKYPENRQLKINGIVTKEHLANPDSFDSEGQPCIVVLKDGCATDLTVGRYTGLESFRCDEDGVESTELAVYNYDKKSGPFSAKGDSGSLVFDGRGRMVGLLHAGKSKSGLTNAHVTYVIPAWWLVSRIKKEYPNADLNRTTW